jgi:hypothetical protein
MSGYDFFRRFPGTIKHQCFQEHGEQHDGNNCIRLAAFSAA